jgi:hypothetical protein
MSGTVEPPASSLERIKSVATIFSLVAVPIIVALVGWAIQNGVKTSDTRLKNLELSISILKESPDLTQPGLRNWAIDNLDRYSDVKLSAEAKEELRSKSLLAVQPVQRNITRWAMGQFSLGKLNEAFGHKIIPVAIQGDDVILQIDGHSRRLRVNETASFGDGCVIQIFGISPKTPEAGEEPVISFACLEG